MLKYQSFALATIFSLGALLGALPTGNAYASFSCGPYMKTYRVRSLSGTPGQGVRCVKFVPHSVTPNLDFIWYGEGYWKNSKYRHVGEAYYDGTNATAGELHSKGEIFDNYFPNSLVITRSGDRVPHTIRVTGAWNEEWILENDNIVEKYTSSFGSVESCGSSFERTYSVRDPTGHRSGRGIRCWLRGARTWYGAGDWDGSSYVHIGSLVSGSRASGAVDICNENTFCNTFDWGSIIIIGQPKGWLTITGAWNEEWIPR